MTHKKFSLFVILCCIEIAGCINKHNNELEIREIKVSFIKGYLERSYRIDCSNFPDSIGVIHSRIKDSLLVDKQILLEINREIPKLKTIQNQNPIDIRIKCYIISKEGKINTLCLGDINGIVYNGEIVEPNLNLSYLIKLNCGFYNYYPIKFLPLFPELKDSLRLKSVITTLKSKLPEPIEDDLSDSNSVEIKF